MRTAATKSPSDGASTAVVCAVGSDMSGMTASFLKKVTIRFPKPGGDNAKAGKELMAPASVPDKTLWTGVAGVKKSLLKRN